jgi:hypothetical protein
MSQMCSIECTSVFAHEFTPTMNGSHEHSKLGCIRGSQLRAREHSYIVGVVDRIGEGVVSFASNFCLGHFYFKEI